MLTYADNHHFVPLNLPWEVIIKDKENGGSHHWRGFFEAI